MKTAELRQQTKEELKRQLQEGREKMRQLRFDLVSGRIKNIREIRVIKKDVARILTILNESEKQK